MAAGHILEVVIGVALFLEASGSFTRVCRVSAVVSGRGPQERRGVILALGDHLIGRIALDPCALFGHARVAIFADPRSAAPDHVIAQHIEQRDLHDGCTEQIRALGEGGADQQATLRAALDAEVFWRCEAARDEVIADRDKVVPRALLVLADRALVPAWPELAAPAHIAEHIGSAALQPHLARGAEIAGQTRDLEASIAGHQHGGIPVHLHASGLDDEVGDLGPVCACRRKLLDLHAACIEARRRGLNRLWSLGAIGVVKRRWIEEVGDREHDLLALV